MGRRSGSQSRSVGRRRNLPAPARRTGDRAGWLPEVGHRLIQKPDGSGLGSGPDNQERDAKGGDRTLGLSPIYRQEPV